MMIWLMPNAYSHFHALHGSLEPRKRLRSDADGKSGRQEILASFAAPFRQSTWQPVRTQEPPRRRSGFWLVAPPLLVLLRLRPSRIAHRLSLVRHGDTSTIPHPRTPVTQSSNPPLLRLPARAIADLWTPSHHVLAQTCMNPHDTRMAMDPSPF